MRYVATNTLEEKKREYVNVIQCTKLRHLIRSIDSHEDWLWPASVAPLIRRPMLMVAFRPHDAEAMQRLDSWLELTLRTGTYTFYIDGNLFYFMDFCFLCVDLM